MIAKRVPRKEANSDFRHLAEYILDKKHDGQKLAAAWTTNTSLPDDFDMAIIETQATQELNTRSRNDKTYHLVISLADGEKLNVEQFKEVERRCCEAIGLGDHHRICAIHHDTNVLHLHIALSKVHPSTLNTIEPYYDKFKLQETCRECEKIFGLRPGIAPERQERQNIVEIRHGVISFQSWIKSKLRDELINLMKHPGCGWQNVQALAGKYGLQIREHKTGLVFSHVSAKLFVKASSVDRSFSKQSMESKLGKFEPTGYTSDPIMTYRCAPVDGGDKGKELYVTYQDEMTKIRVERKELLKTRRDSASKVIGEIKARYTRRRQQVSVDPILTKIQKCKIRKSLSAQSKSEIERYYKEMQEKKKVIMKCNRTRPWREWLHDQAKAGNNNALEILKQRSANRFLGGNSATCNNGDMSQNAAILTKTQPMRSEGTKRVKGVER